MQGIRKKTIKYIIAHDLVVEYMVQKYFAVIYILAPTLFYYAYLQKKHLNIFINISNFSEF